MQWVFVADGTPTEEIENEPPAEDEGLDPVPIVPALTGDLREDIARLQMEDFEVDDYNDPAEKMSQQQHNRPKIH